MSETLMPHTVEPNEPWALQERPLAPEQVEMLRRGKAALLVIDAQKSYTDPNEVLAKEIVHSTTDILHEMVQKLPDLLNAARNSGIPVIWTRMIEDPDKMSKNYTDKMNLEETPALSTPGTRGFEYIGEGLPTSDPTSKIRPAEGEMQITKRTYSAFNKTELDDYLQKQGIETVVLVGAYASRCVLGTAAQAADNGYNLFVVRDLVGNLDADEWEKKPVLNLIGTIYGYIPYAKQVNDVWQQTTPNS